MATLKLFVLRSDEQATGLWAYLRENWRIASLAGRPLAVTVTQYKEKRSQEQNKRYWAILGEIAERVNMNGKVFSAESWHEYFRRYFIGCDELPDGGVIGISTTTLSVEEFSEYMEKITAFAASNLGLELSQ